MCHCYHGVLKLQKHIKGSHEEKISAGWCVHLHVPHLLLSSLFLDGVVGAGSAAAGGLYLRGFLCDTYQFASSHSAAGKASWFLICSIVSLHSPLKGFQTKPRPGSFCGDTLSFNPAIYHPSRYHRGAGSP